MGLIILSTLMLGACQSTDGPPERDFEYLARQAAILEALNMSIGETARNVPGMSLNGWQILDNRNLLITQGNTEHLLLTFRRPCRQIDVAMSIYFEARGAVLNAGDDVVARFIGGDERRCPIGELYRLYPREVSATPAALQ